MPGTTLLDWLRGQPDESLAELLRARPDLVVPAPADLAVLATRAALRTSVFRACEDLDTAALTVLSALVVADADIAPVRLTELGRLLGPDLPPDVLDGALGVLRRRALAWDIDGDVSLTAAARDVAGPHPAGLGPSSAELAEGGVLDSLLAGVDPEEDVVLRMLAAGPPVGRSRDASAAGGTGDSAQGPVARLLTRGLLLRAGSESVQLPREVAFAIRGEHPLGPLSCTPPALPATTLGSDAIDATSAGAVLSVVRQVETLLAVWTAEPAPALRTGGLGVRELRRLTKELAVDATRAALLAELCVAAGLAATSDGPAPAWTPTTHADGWLSAAPEQRWLVLAMAWLELPRLPSLVGERDEADRPMPALSDGLRRVTAPAQRRRVLDSMAEPPPGDAVGDVDALVALLAWRAPRRGGRLRDDIVRWTVAEATALGVVALDAVGTVGRTLLADPEPAAVSAALRAVLPEPVDHVVLQADLTAMAPGPLRADLAADFGLLADVESAGSATVYRITEASLRRALDAGWTAAELHDVLSRRSVTPVPQALRFLVDDVARRHGRLRGGEVRSFLRAEDETLLTEVLAHPLAGVLGMRRIAPTVLVSSLELTELLAGLRSAGFAPAAEDPAGGLLDLRAAPVRLPAIARARSRPARPTALDADRLADLIGRMRAGERAAAAPRGTAVGAGQSSNGVSATVQLLRAAVREHRRVWIGYVDAHGMATERIVEPASVGGGVLEGFDPAEGAIRRFLLHRINSAAVIED